MRARNRVGLVFATTVLVLTALTNFAMADAVAPTGEEAAAAVPDAALPAAAAPDAAVPAVSTPEETEAPSAKEATG